MEDFKQLFQGIYKMMQDVIVPVFGRNFSLWTLFLWGLLGGFVVFFIVKLLK
ncbi:MAG: hypothetical protein IJZ23_08455 [Roseburia sp.]|nr:hypothetical protein [Roseburia sp.]MBQ8279852.1 hypothetical protein [Roseburia sp.]